MGIQHKSKVMVVWCKKWLDVSWCHFPI